MTTAIKEFPDFKPEQIFEAYQKAYNRTDGKSTILVEWGDFYNEK